MYFYIWTTIYRITKLYFLKKRSRLLTGFIVFVFLIVPYTNTIQRKRKGLCFEWRLYYTEPMPEEFPTSEWNEAEHKLIEALRTKGIEDEETRALLQQLADTEEAEVIKVAAETGRSDETSIAVQRKRAKLYYHAGYMNEALDTLEHARLQARSAKNEDLHDAIMAEMDRIEEKLTEKK